MPGIFNMKIDKKIREKVEKIKLLIMDVDGVLTPGYILISSTGSEIKVFDVQDGLGIMLWRKAGLKSAIVTAGRAPAVKYRAECLKVDKVYQHAMNKLIAYGKLKKFFNVSDNQICFIGDDLIDIPILKRVGFSCVVPNGHHDVKGYASYICKTPGGKGAVREVIDLILKAKGVWLEVTKDYIG